MTYLLGGVWAGALNEIVILGFPLGYYMAAQGSLAVFVVEIALYAKLMNAKDLEYGIRLGLAFGAAAAAAYGVMQLAGGDAAGLLGVGRPGRPADPALLFLAGGVIAPVAEEVYFRGLVFGWLRRWGFWPALLLSTALFSALHPAGTGLPLTQFIGGLVFAAAYEIERNLLVPILVHMLGNLALFSLPFLLG